MSKFLKVGGVLVNADRIDQVLFLDREHAAVWVGGRAAPLHAYLIELPEIHRYFEEAMYA